MRDILTNPAPYTNAAALAGIGMLGLIGLVAGPNPRIRLGSLAFALTSLTTAYCISETEFGQSNFVEYACEYFYRTAPNSLERSA